MIKKKPARTASFNDPTKSIGVYCMPCFSPNRMLDYGLKPNGRRDLRMAGVTDQRYKYMPSIPVPCGQCIGCRLARSAEWALRCVHEASLHQANCFITLTYASEHLPEGGTLVKKHFQDFMKRFRKAIYPQKIRMYYCGEYGDKYGRPHYHALIFGYDFTDRILVHDRNRRRSDPPLYKSPFLAKLWGKGNVQVGDVTYQSAGYVARYCLKKQTGKNSAEKYTKIDENGNKYIILREFAQASNRDGIGAAWYAKYASDCFPSDYLVHEAKKCRVPRYYERLFEIDNADKLAEIKSKRVLRANDHAKDLTHERLHVREQCQKAKCKKLIRSYEAGYDYTDV